MATSPIAALVIIALTGVFQAMIFGSELSVVPPVEPETPQFSEDECDGFWEGTGCAIRRAVSWIASVFAAIANAVGMILGALTFNIPGAPWWVRTVFGTAMSGTLIWAVVTLFRGN